MNDRNEPLVLNEETGDYLASGPISPDAVIATAKNILTSRVRRAEPLTEPKVVADYLTTLFAGLEHEVFACLYLDNRHRLIHVEELFRGTIDGCSVHPREVLKAALRNNAAAVILAHNHPSGDSAPSTSDQRLTQRLKDGLALVDIRVLDHFVVAGADTVSFAERGLI